MSILVSVVGLSTGGHVAVCLSGCWELGGAASVAGGVSRVV